MSSTAREEPILLPIGIREVLMSTMPVSEINRWAGEAIVVEAVREHLISRRKAATLLGYEDYESRETFFTRHDLVNDYTMDMVDDDFRAIEQSRAHQSC
jgi:hypothetical protein